VRRMYAGENVRVFPRQQTNVPVKTPWSNLRPTSPDWACELKKLGEVALMERTLITETISTELYL
jgi:hypothetical protein